MRKIKILGILTHFKLKKGLDGKEKVENGAVDFYRIIQPLMHLDKDEFEVDIKWDIKSGFESLDEVTKHYDIIYSSYIDTVQTYVDVKMAANRNNCTWIMDMDDNIWDVSKNHPLIKDFSPESTKFQDMNAILKDVGIYTTTCSFLRYKMVENLKRNIKDITIFPNFTDLTKFDYRKIPEVKRDTINITFTGGSSHFDDLNKNVFTDALTVIMEKYPNVRFISNAGYMPQLKAKFGYKYKYILGSSNHQRFVDEIWAKTMSQSDILVGPLIWSPYSRAKSYLRYLEHSAAKKPSVMERIDPYNEVLTGHPERGFLVSTKEEWIEALSKLIEDEKLRKDMGEEAYKYVKENHTIQGNVKIYEDYFKSILTRPLGNDTKYL